MQAIDWNERFAAVGNHGIKRLNRDSFGVEASADMAELEEKKTYKTKWWELHKRDVTELAAISTLVLFGATILDKLVISHLTKPRRVRRA